MFIHKHLLVYAGVSIDQNNWKILKEVTVFYSIRFLNGNLSLNPPLIDYFSFLLHFFTAVQL